MSHSPRVARDGAIAYWPPRPAAWAALCGVAAALATLGAAHGQPTTETAPPADASAAKAQPKENQPGDKWVRLKRDPQGRPLGMQTAIVTYTGRRPGGDQVTVDLIGAVHVGDQAYYGELNRRFQDYDALLYELVAPEDTVIRPDRQASNAHPVAVLQGGMQSLLELEHQLERVDYNRPNFVHADMSPEEFSQSMEERGESLLQMCLSIMFESLNTSKEEEMKAQAANMELLLALISKDRPRRLKIMMAKQLTDMEKMMGAFMGEDGSTLITERNRVALEVLKKQMGQGKGRLGVFYGAGHLSDMDERLREDFGLTPRSVEWLTAWDLRPK